MTNVNKELRATSRFANRADNYMKYRPPYPEEIVLFLEQTTGLEKHKIVADIGSGTGLFAAMLLRKGYNVVCIEPNEGMRNAAEKKLGQYPCFLSRPGQGEQTGLDDHSVDLITVAQAFHWMKPVPTKQEFRRILKPGGYISLAWNIRNTHTPFLRDFDQLKREFRMELTRDLSEGIINSFFERGTMKIRSFVHSVWLDFDSLKGLLLSASGIPLPGDPSYDTMISVLVQLFVKNNVNGFVLMEYETKVYCGKLG